MTLFTFKVPWKDNLLCGDTCQAGCRAMVLHGAGQSSRSRFFRLRDALCRRGIPSAGFDFVGHGETGGKLLGSTLCERTQQSAAVIRHVCREPLTLIAASMSAHTAIQLTRFFNVETLVLLVPAVYTRRAYHLPFGPEFSAAIRLPESWMESDAFDALTGFRGNLLVVAAECDATIPAEIPRSIHDAASNAASRLLHIVPAAGHRSLFRRDRDFNYVLDLIDGGSCAGMTERSGT